MIKERILKVLREENDSINMDSELIQSGLIDSMALVNLVVELEDEFDVELSVDEITAKNFKNIETIELIINKALEAQK